MKKLLSKSMLALTLLTTAHVTFSDDTELYISDEVKQAGKSTKVLIIFDNSGSMGKTHTVTEHYNPDKYYTPIGSSHAYNNSATYFKVGGADGVSEIPNSPSDARRFLASINSCETSKAILDKYGFYTGHVREFTAKGNNGSWTELPSNNGLDIQVIDCEDDAYIDDGAGNILNEGNVKNADGLPDGYPADGLYSKKNPLYYDDTKTSTNIDWASGEYVTLYTANYLRWYHGQSVNDVVESRMDTAKHSITTVINTTPSVDFGLEVFNYNKGNGSSDGNGGRVVLGIREMTMDAKNALIDVINDELTPETWTPLCESVYEARQYYAGDKIEFGNDDIDNGGYKKNTPKMDDKIISAKDSSKYESPFDECASSTAHIILITDGEPTKDHAADSKIKSLTSEIGKVDENGVAVLDVNGEQVMESVKYTDASTLFNGSQYTADGSNSYLPGLAGWMSTHDVNLNLEGMQNVITHTIGFSSGANAAAGLLKETASRGQGKYFHAKDGIALTDSLTSILSNLKPGNDSLTAASVAANNFDRTQTLDSVYFAMFNPQNAPRWQGNLKKYKAAGGEIIGANGLNAICENEVGVRSFCTNAKSYWSPDVDGDNVAKGGVASWFTSLSGVDKRTIYTDAGAGTLIKYNRENLQKAFTDQAGLAAELNVSGAKDGMGNDIESQAIDDMLNWSMGMDVDDEDKDGKKDDMRNDVFGDPLHSKPLVINYGDSIRILVGTNAGALHMFEDSGSTVKETWAFMPKQFLKNTQALRDNFSSGDKVYGIDGEITAHLDDKDGDGIINGSDTAWIYFGLRRGGDSYYALDVTNPDATPKLMWHKDSSSTGFGHMGQTWSKPRIGYSLLNASGDSASPVVFVGGGYDTNKDTAGPGTADTKGTAVYMLDAKTGTLLWSLTPGSGTKVTTFSGADSIASGIGLLDSSGNGLTDRLYVSDTGGNIWRVDMPGTDISEFSVFNLASLGGTTNATDRRFFYEPSIVRTFISETIETTVTDKDGKTKTITSHQEIPYDALLVGSGDRSNPLGKDTQDKLYMIKDIDIITKDFNVEDVPDTILNTDLYDYTDNPFKDYKSMSTKDLETLQIAVSEKSGWYMDLVQSGEKATAEALAINGVAYYTTFTPPENAGKLVGCKPPLGVGSLYVVDLALGIKRHNNTDDVRPDNEVVIDINNEPLGPPTLIVLPEDDGDDKTKDKATGDIIVGDKIIQADFTLNTSRLYLYTKEDQ